MHVCDKNMLIRKIKMRKMRIGRHNIIANYVLCIIVFFIVLIMDSISTWRAKLNIKFITIYFSALQLTTALTQRENCINAHES